MSCNSAIYTVNSTQPTLAANSQIPFGSVIRRFGSAVQLDGGSMLLCGSGYYDCDVNVTVEPAAIGAITAQLYLDGEAVPGAFATGYAAAAGNPVALSIPALVRICGCGCNKNLSVRIDAAADLVNMGVVVEKI